MDEEVPPPHSSGEAPEEANAPQGGLLDRLLIAMAVGVVVFAISVTVAEHRLSEVTVVPGGIVKTCAASGVLAAAATFLSLRDLAGRRISKKRLAVRLIITVVATMVIGVFMSACHIDPGH